MSIALVDCNNFFVSCERVFRPDLRNKPVIVLSNNDSCVISRSQEVKDLNIAMGDPIFKYENTIRYKKITLFSANFQLYSEISARIMSLLKKTTDKIEVYSIDEAFLDLRRYSNLQSIQLGKIIVDEIYKRVGIPVTVGIAPNKTLAKLACDHGKRLKLKSFSINKNNLEEILKNFLLSRVWGIGRKSSEKLKAAGLKTAYDLCSQDDSWIRQRLSVTGLRTTKELRGEKIFECQSDAAPQKSIMVSRSFGELISELNDLKQAVGYFVDSAVSRMRMQGLTCAGISVFLISKKGYWSAERRLISNDDSKLILTKIAYDCLLEIYTPNSKYKKAGIKLLGLTQSLYKQVSLFDFEDKADKPSPTNLESSIEKINKNWGSDTIQAANLIGQKKWQSKAKFKSPDYLSKWDDIPTVKAFYT